MVSQVLSQQMTNIAYPIIFAFTGGASAILTAVATTMKADTLALNPASAFDAADKFSAFGPFAQLYVASLILCVVGIAWYARITQVSIAEHRRRNDELLKALLDSYHADENNVKEKDVLISKLVKRLTDQKKDTGQNHE